MVTLSEPGFAPVPVIDTANTGTVSFFGSYGDFSTNLVIGFSNKLTAAGVVATLQVQSLDVKNVAAGTGARTLTVTLTDDAYTFPGTAASVMTLGSALGGTITGGTAGDAVGYTSTATPAGGSTVTVVSTPFVAATNPGVVSFSLPAASGSFVRGTSYKLSSLTTLSLSGPGSSANLSGSTSASVAVPEPATVGLAAAGLVALAGRRRRPC